MSAGRSSRVKALFDAAHALPVVDRDAFLDRVAADDPALRDEIRSLLAADREAVGVSGPLSALPSDRSPAAPDPNVARRVGESIAHFRIDAVLGTGGMGIVYRAHDTRLERTVAVKVVSDRFLDPTARQRLLREARHASALNHPNICTIYEIGDLAGDPFIAMEYVDGESLDKIIARQRPSIGHAIDYGSQIAAALAHAHERSIVHRDLKTANVVIGRDGRAKVLDFGVAVRLDLTAVQTATGSQPIVDGAVAGTLAYMAPEALRGDQGDQRRDLWSLGVMLYEMLTGALPFKGRTAFELTSAILHDAAAPLPEGIPGSVTRIVGRCLQKVPAERWERAVDVKQALEEAVRTMSPGSGRTRTGPSVSAPVETRSIAVLPFKDLASDPANAHIGIGLADATITELAGITALLVRPTAAMLRYRDSVVDPLTAARELGVDSIVDASFQRSGSRLRVTVQLLDARDGRALWARKITTSLDDVFEMQDEVSRKIAEALEIDLTEGDRSRLRHAARAASSEYELYLEGRLHLLQETIGSINVAVDCFERARAADPRFALAWAGLADAYARIAHTFDPDGNWYHKAAQAAATAIELNPNLPEARYVRGRLFWSPGGGFRHGDAIAEFAAALAARPGLNEAHDWLGIVLFHISMPDEAAAHFERALAINPQDDLAFLHLGFCRYLQGAFQAALDISNEARRRCPAMWSFYQVALAEIQLGSPDAAAKTVEMAERQFPGDMLLYPLRGLLAALEGKRAAAERHIELTIRNAKSFGHYHHAQYDIACVQSLLGRSDDAIRWLTDAAHNGFPCNVFFERDPLLAPIRADARFAALMTALKDECAQYRLQYEAHQLLGR